MNKTVVMVNSPKGYLYNRKDGTRTTLFDNFVIGRNESDLRLPNDVLISGKHCRFRVLGDEIYIEDLKSTNKTRVNGVVITALIKLYEGDVINIGNAEFSFSFSIKNENKQTSSEKTTLLRAHLRPCLSYPFSPNHWTIQYGIYLGCIAMFVYLGYFRTDGILNQNIMFRSSPLVSWIAFIVLPLTYIFSVIMSAVETGIIESFLPKGFFQNISKIILLFLVFLMSTSSIIFFDIVTGVTLKTDANRISYACENGQTMACGRYYLFDPRMNSYLKRAKVDSRYFRTFADDFSAGLKKKYPTRLTEIAEIEKELSLLHGLLLKGDYAEFKKQRESSRDKILNF